MAYLHSLKCKTSLNFICSILAQLLLINLQLAYAEDRNLPTNQPTIPESNFHIISQNLSQKITINKEFEKNNARIFQTFDPNFQPTIIEKWVGIPWKKIHVLMPEHSGKTVTFVAKNQYICQESTANLIKFGAFLAIKKGDANISPSIGGPLKLMFELPHSSAAYCWYVDTIYTGEPQKPTLSVTNGEKVQILTKKDIEKFEVKTFHRNFPIPRGYRFSDFIPQKNTEIKGFLLSDLVKTMNISGSKIFLKAEVGRQIQIPDTKKLDDILIAYQIENKPIPVSWGGPFVALSLQENQIENKLNAQFFLNKIEISQGEIQN